MMKETIQEDKIIEYVIDFKKYRENKLDESFLAMFGETVKIILKRMLGEDIFVPVSFRGSQAEIQSFARTLASEKRYLEAYKSHGLNNPRTYQSKYQLDGAVSEFERKTGITWPFK